jgi:dihydroorotase/N-acyl-D-amino-acid deacylase
MLILRGGRVFDGVASTGASADVRVVSGRIDEVAPRLAAPPDATVIDVAGRSVVPGFIDVHSHDDLAVRKSGGVEPKIRQGVTSTVVGNCGHGCAPSAEALMRDYSAPVLGTFPVDARWDSFPAYLATLASRSHRINVAALAPHGPLRWSVLGAESRAADQTERAEICARAAECLAAGAVGISLGLMYQPGNAADTAELEALAAVAARRGKLLVAHLRNEASRLLESIDEFLALGRRTGCALHISHLKVTAPANFGAMPQVIEKLDSARAEGIDVTADVYPYLAGSTTIATLFPQWALRGGLPQTLADPAQRARVKADLRADWGALENYYRSLGPERIRLVGFSTSENASLEGQSIAEAAAQTGLAPDDCLVELTIAEKAQLAVILFQIDESDLRAALGWPWTMIGSDGLPTGGARTHPRLYGTFPRVLSRYRAQLGFGEAIRKMTSLPAQRFGLADRGVIAAGRAADLAVIEPDALRDRATFDNPRQFPNGVIEVVLNGEPALAVDRRSGRFLTGRGADDG